MRLLTAFVVLALASSAEAKKPRAPQPKSPSTVLATYPEDDAGTTYQLERETCTTDDCHVVLSVSKDGKNSARFPVARVPGGSVEKLKPDPKATSPMASADTWAIASVRARKQEGKLLFTIVPFALDVHEQGLLLRTMIVLPEEGLPTSNYALIGWANGSVQELFRAQQSEVEADLDVEVHQVEGEPEVVLTERSVNTDQIQRYGLYRRDDATGRFTRERALFGVALGIAEDKRGLVAAARSCNAFTGAASAKLLYGPAFTALGESGGVAVAITTDEKQAKQWVEELTSCHKGTAPVVARLK